MKKKILTIFLTFAIVMTFMPSMAFAENSIKSIQASINISSDSTITFETMGNTEVSVLVLEFYNDKSEVVARYVHETEDAWFDPAPPSMELEAAPNLKEVGATSVKLMEYISWDGENVFANDINGSLKINGKSFILENSSSSGAPPESPKDTGTVFRASEETIIIMAHFYLPTENDEDDILMEFVKGAVHAVATVVGTAVRNAQKIAFAKQMAYKTKMWQMAVQQQIYSIKAFRHTQDALTFAQFKLAINNLLRFSQFGFNPFGFR